MRKFIFVVFIAACWVSPDVSHSQDIQQRNCLEALEENNTVITLRDWSAILRATEKANRLCKGWDTEADVQERNNARLPALFNLGRTTEALDEANRCIASNSTFAVCHYWKAAALFELGRSSEAKFAKAQGVRLCEVVIKKYEESALSSRDPSTYQEIRSRGTYEITKAVLENFRRLEF